MYNEIVVVKVDFYKEKGNVASFDSNGKANIILTPVAGKIPNQAMVMAGSVAQGNKFLDAEGKIPHDLVMIMIVEKAPDPTHGRQFGVQFLDAVSAKEVIQHRRDLGEGVVIETKPKAATGAGNTGDNPQSAEDAAKKGETPVLALQPADLDLDEDADKTEDPAPAADPAPAVTAKVNVKAPK